MGLRLVSFSAVLLVITLYLIEGRDSRLEDDAMLFSSCCLLGPRLSHLCPACFHVAMKILYAEREKDEFSPFFFYFGIKNSFLFKSLGKIRVKASGDFVCVCVT